MELDVMMPQKVVVKTVKVHVKVTDMGNYTLCDYLDRPIAEKSEDYVPGFFPGDHHGDYLILDIDLDTGKITNWVTPKAEDVIASFNLGSNED